MKLAYASFKCWGCRASFFHTLQPVFRKLIYLEECRSQMLVCIIKLYNSAKKKKKYVLEIEKKSLAVDILEIFLQSSGAKNKKNLFSSKFYLL